PVEWNCMLTARSEASDTCRSYTSENAAGYAPAGLMTARYPPYNEVPVISTLAVTFCIVSCSPFAHRIYRPLGGFDTSRLWSTTREERSAVMYGASPLTACNSSTTCASPLTVCNSP